MAREDLHFRLRIPEDLKKRLEAHADLNNRSMTAEIVVRLTESVNDDARLRLRDDEIKDLKLKLAYQEGMSASLRNSLNIFMKHLGGTDVDTSGVLEKIIDEIKTGEPWHPVKGD
ncbi:Arc family DNA-binding protein [Mesorhizobium australicum]|uniref:Arc family DNA-binding protein n=1 Tax=Mesorhizobium australicum TaxID=536018 RepID=A0ACC6T2R7_9HYPH